LFTEPQIRSGQLANTQHQTVLSLRVYLRVNHPSPSPYIKLLWSNSDGERIHNRTQSKCPTRVEAQATKSISYKISLQEAL
jgi:hypothetical protein